MSDGNMNRPQDLHHLASRRSGKKTDVSATVLDVLRAGLRRRDRQAHISGGPEPDSRFGKARRRRGPSPGLPCWADRPVSSGPRPEGWPANFSIVASWPRCVSPGTRYQCRTGCSIEPAALFPIDTPTQPTHRHIEHVRQQGTLPPYDQRRLVCRDLRHDVARTGHVVACEEGAQRRADQVPGPARVRVDRLRQRARLGRSHPGHRERRVCLPGDDCAFGTQLAQRPKEGVGHRGR